MSVSRRIALSEENMRKVVKFLLDWLGQRNIAEGESGLLMLLL